MTRIKVLILSSIICCFFFKINSMPQPLLTPYPHGHSPPPPVPLGPLPDSPPSSVDNLLQSPLSPVLNPFLNHLGLGSYHPAVRAATQEELTSKELLEEFPKAVHQKRTQQFFGDLQAEEKKMIAKGHIIIKGKQNSPRSIPSLLYALSASDFAAAHSLLIHGANPAQKYRGANALHMAIENGAPPDLLARLLDNPKLEEPYPLTGDNEVSLLGYTAQHASPKTFILVYGKQKKRNLTTDIEAFALSLHNKRGADTGRKIRKFLRKKNPKLTLHAPALRYLMHTQPSMFPLIRKPLIGVVCRLNQSKEGACEELLRNALQYQDFISFAEINDAMDPKITHEMADSLLLQAASDGDNPDTSKFVTHLLQVMGAGKDFDQLEHIAQATQHSFLLEVVEEGQKLFKFREFKKGADKREHAQKKRQQEQQLL